MRYKYKRFKGPNTPSLVISNHNTDLDPALLGITFSRHMYFLSSEHALRAGFVSKILNFIFSPITIDKTHTDIPAIKEMLRRLKAGASVCLFAEGNRSFNGVTAPIAISTAKLVKTSGADLITYRFDGAYFASPRWAKNVRKGLITGEVVNKYTAAELKSMSAGEVLGVIERDIFVDAYKQQKETLRRYRGSTLAENLETVLYLCPKCRRIGTIKSADDRFFCGCGIGGIYSETGFLEGEALPFSTITEWDRWQISELPDVIKSFGDKPICIDENQQLFEVLPAVRKTLVGEGAMSIDSKAFTCAGRTFPLEDITEFAIVSQMTLLFGLNDGSTYEVRSAAPRSALKYREIFHILADSSPYTALPENSET